MAKRKELKAIAHSLLDSFVTRYNQVGGYWALGKLYSHDVREGDQGIVIDLLAGSITPNDAEFRGVVRHYRNALAERCRAKQIPTSWLKCAKLHLRFDVKTESPPPPWPAAGDPFEFRLFIEDDEGRTRSARKRGLCFPHDQRREHKSVGPDTGVDQAPDSEI